MNILWYNFFCLHFWPSLFFFCWFDSPSLFQSSIHVFVHTLLLLAERESNTYCYSLFITQFMSEKVFMCDAKLKFKICLSFNSVVCCCCCLEPFLSCFHWISGDFELVTRHVDVYLTQSSRLTPLCSVLFCFVIVVMSFGSFGLSTLYFTSIYFESLIYLIICICFNVTPFFFSSLLIFTQASRRNVFLLLFSFGICSVTRNEVFTICIYIW